MKETKGRQKETKTHTFTVELSLSELERIDEIKASGRKIGHFVREAIVEKLSREKRGVLEVTR